MKSPLRSRLLWGTALVTAAALVVSATGFAQNRNPRNTQPEPPPPAANRNSELRTIDQKAMKVQDEFVKGAVDLARDYEKAGDLERSIQLLEAVLKVQPNLELVSQKVDALKDQVLSANNYKIDIDADGSWGKPVGYVRQGKPLRIRVTGSYRFTANLTVGPQGFPEGDVQTEMLKEIPCGAVAALVAAKDRPGEPFLVGADRDVTPKESGFLYLKVNVPPGSKCTGKLNVQLSGYVLAPDLNNIGSK